MAGAALIIKVSESKYKETLDKLNQQLAKQKDYKEQLEAEKQRLKGGFAGLLGDKTAEMIDVNIRNVDRSIEKTQNMIDKIENYLNSMQGQHYQLDKDLNDAIEEANGLFDD